jgi:hypothetical protein
VSALAAGRLPAVAAAAAWGDLRERFRGSKSREELQTVLHGADELLWRAGENMSLSDEQRCVVAASATCKSMFTYWRMQKFTPPLYLEAFQLLLNAFGHSYVHTVFQAP